jgi:tetratricopeptide (TPR) repeat protein
MAKKRVAINPPEQRPNSWILVFILLIVTVIVYFNCLGNGFVFDDELLITDQAYYLRNLGNALSSAASMVFRDKTTAEFYRPVLMLSYFIDYNLGKGQAFGFHLTNIILHLTNIFLVFYLTALLFADERPAFLAALFFSIHPVQSEAVAWISGRNDTLMLIFILAAFIFYVRYLGSAKRGKWFFLIGLSLCFLFALLTKESAMIFPFAFLGYDYFIKGGSLKEIFNRETIRAYLFMGAIVAVYFLARLSLIRVGLYSNFNLAGLGLSPLVYGFYLKALVFPGSFSVIPFIKTQVNIFEYFLRSIPFIALLAGVIIFKKRNPMISFGSWWGMIALLPVSGIIPLPVIVMEHRLYSAMFGFALIFASVVKYLLALAAKSNFKVMVMVLLLAMFAGLSWLTVERNLIFKDALSLWAAAVDNNPFSDQAHTNLGAVYINEKRYSLAEEELKKAIELNPRNEITRYNLGYLYLLTGREQPGRSELLKAVELDPKYIKAHYNLGIMAMKAGNYEETINKMKLIIKINPNYVMAYNTMGDVYYNLRNDPMARENFELAQKIDPKDEHSKAMLEELRRIEH